CVVIERNVGRIDSLSLGIEFLLMTEKEKETDEKRKEFIEKLCKLIKTEKEDIERAYRIIQNVEKIANAIGDKNGADA
ncbi:UNVERIFIED_CONTAM: hypothetical protein IGO34_35280, partial [Salmonella enterica subsp. enterica serovar Weltevreden]